MKNSIYWDVFSRVDDFNLEGISSFIFRETWKEKNYNRIDYFQWTTICGNYPVLGNDNNKNYGNQEDMQENLENVLYH